MSLRALDVCAGAGGLSLGFQRAGWDVLGVERDGDAWHTHRENVGPCRLADITEFRPAQQFDAVIGGPPCTGFSMAGLRKGSDLFRHLIRIGVEAGARALLLENVEGMVSWRDKRDGSPTFGVTMPTIIEDAMLEAGFCPEWRVINCADFGTPQIRKRIIFAAFAEIECAARWTWPDHSHGDRGGRPWVSVREALGLSGAFAHGRREGARGFQGERMLDVDMPGVTVGTKGNAEWLSPLDSPSPCVTATEGRSAKNFGSRGGKTKPRHAIERIQVAMDRLDQPAPAIKVNSSHEGTSERASQRPMGELAIALHTTHRLGPDELAILQGFPPGFRFHGNKTAQYRQIGNAFCPQPSEAIGRQLAKALGDSHAQVQESQ